MEDCIGSTILMLTCKYGYQKIVEIILQHNATNINTQNEYGYTAIMYAYYELHTNIIPILLKYGANINIQNLKEYTPFTIAHNSKKVNTDKKNKIIQSIKNHIKNKKMEVLKVVYKGESKYNIPLLPVAKNDMARVISKFVV